ncbi:hypothetical protein Nepgr_027223 [Nepenthes gracilis]|uniref:Uncharacterized protein n=1 Tax=Nepenthes gracilis TaxID=150966 RepID=A0AAD3Y2R3_NEPGR|nr:hypothetical protein Nepgr_027223 [Nepenthes gracilis]
MTLQKEGDSGDPFVQGRQRIIINSIHYVNSHNTNDETFDPAKVRGQPESTTTKIAKPKYAFSYAKNSEARSTLQCSLGLDLLCVRVSGGPATDSVLANLCSWFRRFLEGFAFLCVVFLVSACELPRLCRAVLAGLRAVPPDSRNDAAHGGEHASCAGESELEDCCLMDGGACLCNLLGHSASRCHLEKQPHSSGSSRPDHKPPPTRGVPSKAPSPIKDTPKPLGPTSPSQGCPNSFSPLLSLCEETCSDSSLVPIGTQGPGALPAQDVPDPSSLDGPSNGDDTNGREDPPPGDHHLEPPVSHPLLSECPPPLSAAISQQGDMMNSAEERLPYISSLPLGSVNPEACGPARKFCPSDVLPPLGSMIPSQPGQGESTPAPPRSKPKTSGQPPPSAPAGGALSKSKPSGRSPPPAPAGEALECFSPKRVANAAEAGVKYACAVSTANAFVALQNPEVSTLPEEPQAIPLPDSDSCRTVQSSPACDPPIPKVIQLVEIPPGPSSTIISSATRSSRLVARRVPVEEPPDKVEKDVGPPKLVALGLEPRWWYAVVALPVLVPGAFHVLDPAGCHFLCIAGLVKLTSISSQHLPLLAA